jgi:endonuclease/exonuclease/phosphatase family metal-dependent hydrolase
LAFLLLLAWLMGRIASDRWPWSQWLLWIPTPAALAAALLGALAALRPSRRPRVRRRRLLRWVAASFAVVIYFILIEHRWLRSAPNVDDRSSSVKLAHWNLTVRIDSPDALQGVMDRLIDLDSDITVLAGPAYAAWQPPVIEALGQGQQPVSLGPLVVLSRMPILTVDQIGADQAFVLVVKIDATAKLGRPIVLYAVDLPSNPYLSRMAMAQRVRRLLDDSIGSDNIPPPDLVAGDFNLTRHSASLARLFPNMEHAYDQAGHGYGATFNRRWMLPLYHIDHVLVAPGFVAKRYDLVDPGMTRHKAQLAWIGTR